MKPTDRQKMCINCDGRVPFEAIVCPYCSCDLAKAIEVDVQRDVGDKHQAIQDSLTALYTPPYQQKGSKNSFSETKGKKTEPSKSANRTDSRVAPPAHHGGALMRENNNSRKGDGEPTSAAGTRDPAQDKAAKAVLVSILTLSVGSLLFILGILQIFFAEDGILRLEWNASRWFIYCLASLPLLYYGYRKAEQEDK